MLSLVCWALIARSDPLPATALRDELESAARVRGISFEEIAAGALETSGIDALVWDTRSRALPPEALEEHTKEAVRHFVERGGGLLLLSFAAAYLHELGLEPVPPDRHDTRLIGHSDSFGGASYDYGLRLLDPDHPLGRGLTPHRLAAGGGSESGIFFLAGGPALRLEACFWERAVPRDARVLATYHRNAFGEERAFPHRCLVERHFGKGIVLACGLGPLGIAGDPHAENLRRFVANALGHLGGGKPRPRVALLPAWPARLGIDAYSSAPPPPEPAPPWPTVRGPLLPWIAHWGWLAPIDYQRSGARSVDLDYVSKRIVAESAIRGANLVEFYPPDMEQGYPFAWEADDPLPRPQRYWGGAFDPRWSMATVRRLAERAHARGMLIHAFFHPNPVSGPLDAFVAFGEHTWRDLSNPLLHGWQQSLDGYGSEWQPVDRDAAMTSILWKYNPGTYQHSTAVLPAYTPNFSGTLMCAFGRLAHTNACGFSDQWRPLYHPPLYLSYQADCRSRKPSTRDWGGWAHYGGGSWPDWILRQANDFCRERLDLDAAIWWLGEPDSTMSADGRDAVYAVSMDPIHGAFTSALTATGSDGYRAVIAGQVPNAPAAYVAAPAQPSTTWMLQNDRLRLYRRADRDQGILVADPLRLARFDPDARGHARAAILSQDLVHSELEGFSPDVAAALVARWQAPAGRGASGKERHDWETVAVLEGGDPLPERIAYEADPECPGTLIVRFRAPIGQHRVTIERGEGSPASLVQVFLDRRPIGFYLAGGEDTAPAFTFGVVEPGRHEISLQVQDGPGHTLRSISIERLTRQAVAHRCLARGGVEARLEEIVARETRSGIMREVRVWTLRSEGDTLRLDVRREGDDGDPLALHLHGAVLQDASGAASRKTAGDDVVVAVPPRGVLLRFELAGDGRTLRFTDEPEAEAVTQQETSSQSIEVTVRRPSAHDTPRPEPVALSREPLRRLAEKIGEPPRLFVREVDAAGQPWWTQRGAQPLPAPTGADEDAGPLLIKTHPRANDPAIVRVASWLRCGFRPGWGCQYTLAFAGDSPRGEAVVRVEKTGPFLFAPRVEFEAEVSGVVLDGHDWRYLDGRNVFLPNRPGTYRVRLEERRRPAPSLARTFLDVRTCAWDEQAGILEIETAPPSWYPAPLPGGKPYTAMILTAGLTVSSIEGAEPIAPDTYPLRTAAAREAMQDRGLIVRLRPGRTRIRFER